MNHVIEQAHGDIPAGDAPPRRLDRRRRLAIGVCAIAAAATVAAVVALASASGPASPPVPDVQAAKPSLAAMVMNGGGMAGTGYWRAVSGGQFRSDGTVRTYYISADEVVWDYAPDGRNDITGSWFHHSDLGIARALRVASLIRAGSAESS